MSGFRDREYAFQAAYLNALDDVATGHEGSRLMLARGHENANFAPRYADAVQAFFAFQEEASGAQNIDWHTRSNHGASSQACCVNFLFPMVHDADLATLWLRHVTGVATANVLPIDKRCGHDCYLTFEWFPPTDYLNEANAAGVRPRGSNSTSVDAAMRYEVEGRVELLMIEWKYTESYGAKRTDREVAGDATRVKRYQNIWQRPHGPIRADANVALEDFFLNPWYQLLRQQMLAYHCETDPLSEYARATLLHISPSANASLKRAKGKLAAATGLSNVFDAFASLLDPAFRDRFQSMDTSQAFALAAYQEHEHAAWLKTRYPALF